MKASQANPGRVFILRLEDGDILHESIEEFARSHSIRAAALIVLGGADAGSLLVVGPEKARAFPVTPMEYALTDVHEVAGVGTLFPNADGEPVLHMHIAGGRNDATVTGCVRLGVRAWHVMEVVLWELVDTEARRLPDAATGFSLLQP
jgi:predicted DNA-binding protein with PD1-like motif